MLQTALSCIRFCFVAFNESEIINHFLWLKQRKNVGLISHDIFLIFGDKEMTIDKQCLYFSYDKIKCQVFWDI